MADPTDSSFCPQWPDRCCFCLTKRYGVMFTSLFSILSDFFFISCFSYLIYDPMEWNKGKIRNNPVFMACESFCFSWLVFETQQFYVYNNSIEVQSVDVVQVKNIAKKAKNTYRCSKTPLHKNFKLSLQQNVKNHSYPEKSCRSQKCLV